MSWGLYGTHAKDGDLVELVGLKHKHFMITVNAGGELQSHRGVIKHDDIIGKPWGSQVFSHNGAPFFLMQPALANVLKETRRATQILYPKEIGFILVTMGIGPGSTVIEAGTGSGALTTAFAYAVGPQGHVFTYEQKAETQKVAISNLTRLGLAERVSFHLGDIAAGFEDSGADALFLDLPNPYDYLAQVRAALNPGGFFGTILPTTNQVCLLLAALRRANFAFIDVCEILLRYYKAEPERFRPTDRMVAHTGFLIFARPVLVSEGGSELLDETVISADDAAA